VHEAIVVHGEYVV